MALSLSVRANSIEQPEIRNMSIECDRVNGINLSQGVCDTEVPQVVRKAAQKAIDANINQYTRYDGLEYIREAIAEKYKRFYGFSYNSETEIIVSSGSTGALFCTCFALFNPSDEVLVFEPFYGYHLDTLKTTQLTPRFIRMQPPEWEFTAQQVEDQITDRTKAIIINTPNNPTGKVYSKEEMQIIGEIAEEHDLFVITDEIYEHFVYDDERKHILFASLPGMRERTITISGLSKSFSITGWRIGYSLCSARWADAIGYFNDLLYVCAPAPLQMGAAQGILDLEENYYWTLGLEYKAKRDKLCEALAKAGLELYVPSGAYYVLADISRIPGESAKAKCMELLNKTGIGTVPGSAFYSDEGGNSIARFCYAKDADVIDEACKRLEGLHF